MLKRIQALFLLMALVSIGVFMLFGLPPAKLVAASDSTDAPPLVLLLQLLAIEAHPLRILMQVSAALAAAGIFLYRRRRWQWRVCIAGAVCLAVCQALALAAMDDCRWLPLVGLPAIADLLMFAAARRISADQALLQAQDRLR